MFSAGTRVYICSSAVTGKKLGPKRHSLGYISDSSTTYFVKYVKNFPIKNQSFIFTPLKIVFTKYGREEKQRRETRDFLQIMPVFKEKRKSESVAELTKQILSLFNDGELVKNTNWRDLCENYGSPLNVGAVIPAGYTKATRMTVEDTVAWIVSILRNSAFSNLIRANRKLPTLMKLVDDQELLIWISNAVMASTARSDLIKWTRDESSNMERLVRVLQRINIAFSKRMLDSSIRNGRILLDGTSLNQINSYLTWLTDRIFDDKRIIARKKAVVKKAQNSNGVYIALARNMEPTRSEYLNLKPKYV